MDTTMDDALEILADTGMELSGSGANHGPMAGRMPLLSRSRAEFNSLMIRADQLPSLEVELLIVDRKMKFFAQVPQIVFTC